MTRNLILLFSVNYFVGILEYLAIHLFRVSSMQMKKHKGEQTSSERAAMSK